MPDPKQLNEALNFVSPGSAEDSDRRLAQLDDAIEAVAGPEPVITEAKMAEDAFQAPTKDAAPLLQTARQFAANFGVGGHDHAGPYLKEAEAAGLEGAMELTAFHDQIRNEALHNYNYFARQQGWHDLQGQGVERAKTEITGAFIAHEFVKNMPLFGKERIKVVADNMRHLIDQRVSEIFGQARGAGMTEETVETNQRLAAIAHQIKSMSDDQLEQLWRQMVWVVNDKPSNRVEQTIFDDRGEYGHQSLQKRLSKMAIMEEGGVAVEMQRMRPWQLSLMDKITGAAPPPINESAKGMHPRIARERLEELLGKDYARIIYQHVQKGKTNYLYHRSGILETPDSVAGVYDPNGVNPLVLAPKGALQTIFEAQASAVAPAVPALRKRIRTIRYTAGKEAAAEAVGALAVELYNNAKRHLQTIDTQIISESMGLTPTEALKRGTAGTIAGAAMDALIEPLMGIKETVDFVEEGIVRGSPWVTHVTQSTVGPLLGDWNRNMTTAIRKPSEAIAVLFKAAMDRGAIMTSLKDGMPQLAQQSEVFKNAGPEFLKELLLEDNNAMAAYQQYFAKSLDNWDKINEEIWKEGDQVKSLPKTMLNVVKATGYSIYHGLLEGIPMTIDDPNLGLSLLLGGKAMQRVGGAMYKQVSPIFQRYMHGLRLNLDMRQIARFYPEKIEPINKLLKKKLQEAVDNPVSPIATTEKLSDMAGAVGALRDSWVHTGAVKPGDFAKIMAEAWPHIKGEFGLLGHTLGTKMVERTWVAKVVEPFMAAMGKSPKKRNATISALVNDAEATGDIGSGADLAITALRDMFGGRATATHMENQLAKFIEKNGRKPTGAELADMLPEDVQPLYGMLLAADDNVTKQPIWDALGRVMGKQNLKDIMPEIHASAEKVMNQWVDDSIQLLHNTHELGIKKMRGDLLINAARHKAEHLADVLELDSQATRRLAIHGNLSERQVQQLNRSAQESAQAANIHRKHSQLFAEIRERMHRHGAHQGPWQMPRGVGLEDYLTVDMIEVLVDNNRALFSGFTPQAFYETIRTPHPKAFLAEKQAAVHEVGKRVRALGRDLNNVNKNPLKYDQELRGMKKQLKELEDAYTEAKKDPPPSTDEIVADGQIITAPPTPDEQFLPGINALKKQIETREADLNSGQVKPGSYDDIKAALLEATEEHKRLNSEFRTLKAEGKTRQQINKRGLVQFRKMIEYDGPIGMKERLKSVDQMTRSFKVGKSMRILEGNPFDPSTLPIRAKGKHLYTALMGIRNQMTAASARVEELIEIQNQMSPRQRDILGAAQAAGVEPSQLYKQFPRLKEIYRQFRDLPVDEQANLDRFFKEESAMFEEFFEMAGKTGRFPKHVLDAWRKESYNPPIYGIYERPHMITERLGRQSLATIQGKRKAIQGDIPAHEQNDRFLFKRDRHKWRLRIEEPDQVIDKLFDSKKKAQQYILEHYDRETLDLTKNVGREGVINGQTMYGDEFTLGAPFSKPELELLDADFRHSSLPHRRLARLQQAFRDVYLDNMFEAFNLYGDKVLTPARFAEIEKTGNDALIAKYVSVPDNPKAFGGLSGKYVHRGVLNELNRSLSTWDNLNAALDGMRQSFQTYLGDVPTELVEKTPHAAVRTIDWVANAARSNLILKSIKAWAVQPMFNFFSDHLAGSRVFRAENIRNLRKAMSETWHGNRDLLRDPLFREANQEGILTGFFTHRSKALRESMSKMLGMLERQEGDVKALLKRRVELRNRLEGEGTLSESMAVQLEADLASIRSALRDAEKKTIRRMFRWLGGTMVDPQTNLGLPANKLTSWMRASFSWMDEWFKYAQYRNLRESGLPRKVAARKVKLFSQNYAEIPHAIRAIPGPIKSLVTSFPYELGRISANAMRFAPGRFLGYISMIPAFNFMNMIRTGVNWDRMEAIMEARGRHDWYEKGWFFATTLMGLEMNGEMDWSMDFHNAIPFGDALTGHGLLPQMYDNWMPPEHRGWLGSVGRLAVGATSNFVGNTPLYNFAGMAYSGRDEFTGRPLFDPKAGAMERSMGYLKLLAKEILPPMAPFGRDFTGIQDSIDAGISPLKKRRTAPTAMERGIRSLLNIDVRGLSNLLGLNSGDKRNPLVNDDDLIISTLYRVKTRPEFGGGTFDEALESDNRELKEIMGRAMDEARGPEERARAMADFDEVMRREYNLTMRGIKVGMSKTERQMMIAKNRIRNDGIVERFGAARLDAQAMVIALLDQYEIHPDKMLELVNAAKYTDQASFDRETDPGMVRRALSILEQRVDKPGHSPHLDELVTHLRSYALPMAEASLKRESKLQDVKRKRVLRIREALKHRK